MIIQEKSVVCNLCESPAGLKRTISGHSSYDGALAQAREGQERAPRLKYAKWYLLADVCIKWQLPFFSFGKLANKIGVQHSAAWVDM